MYPANVVISGFGNESCGGDGFDGKYGVFGHGFTDGGCEVGGIVMTILARGR